MCSDGQNQSVDIGEKNHHTKTLVDWQWHSRIKFLLYLQSYVGYSRDFAPELIERTLQQWRAVGHNSTVLHLTSPEIQP